jgi:general secretion pathway protein C
MATIKTQKSKLPFYISLLLVIALGISLAKLMWIIVTPVPAINAKIDNQTTLASSATTPRISDKNFGKMIANLHLFGEIKKVPVVVTNTAPKEEPKTPPPVKLNLKLHGIVAYTNRKGFALISSNGNKQKVYGQGDKIDEDENVTVKQLFPEKVLINNHGTIIELVLPSNKNKKAATSNTMNSGRQSPVNASMRNQRPASIPGSSRPPASAAPDLSQFRKQVLSNPAKLMDVAKPSPAYNDETDEFIGFRVQPGSNRQIFRQIGLRANDIITSVNGIAMDSPQKGAMVLGELQQASSITIEVKRG